MAVYDKFYIGYTDNNSGLTTNFKPYAIPDNAFQQLQNAYIFRGRVRKRWGTQLLPGANNLYSKLGMQIGTTDGAGNITAIVPGAIFAVGQKFLIGNEELTVVALGAPGAMLTTGASTVHTFNTSTGQVIINGAPINIAVWWYPNQPVIALSLFEIGIVFGNPTYAFDTQFAYQYTNGSWDALALPTWTVMRGSSAQLLWTYSYRQASPAYSLLFITNNNNTLPNPDYMQYYDPTLNTWTIFNPTIAIDTSVTPNVTYKIQTALCIAKFERRMVLFNITESVTPAGGATTYTQYVNRIRYSAENDALDQTNSWRQDIRNEGFYIDAPTAEPITSIEFIKNRLIVYFSDSTYELVPLNNPDIPYVLQKLNTELGCEATFSTIPFDQQILNIGKTGIQACNGSNVQRIDAKIPQDVFDIHLINQDNSRTYGIRDYFLELAYWTFPSVANDSTFPDRILIFNYVNNSWSFFNDTYTCFGYWEDQSDVVLTYQYRQVLTGNQQGFVSIIDSDVYYNAESLNITNIAITPDTITITAINHNLLDDWIYISGCVGVNNINNLNWQVDTVIDENTITLINPDIPKNITGNYLGGGYISRVSQINILTKEFNPYSQQARNLSVNKIDFFVKSTTYGEFTLAAYPSSNMTIDNIQAGIASGSYLGTGIISTVPYPNIPLESGQTRLWHSIYPQIEGTSATFRFYLSDTEMANVNITQSDFQLHAFTMYARPTRYRMA